MSLANALLPLAIRASGRARTWRTREHLVRAVDRREPWPASPPAFRDLAVESDSIGGWPAVRLVPPGAAGTYVHLHGGGYVFGPQAQHWSLLHALALASGRTVVAPLYPLAPQGVAGDAVPTAAAIVGELMEHGDVVLGGDSAGGGMALAAAQLLAVDGLRPKLALVAPWVDALLDDAPTAAADRSDPWLGAEGLRAAADLYRGDLEVSHPFVSPLRGELGGLGPVTVITGTRDVLHPQALRLVRGLTSAGTPVDPHVAVGMLHDVPLLPVPEARPYRRLLADLLRSR